MQILVVSLVSPTVRAQLLSTTDHTAKTLRKILQTNHSSSLASATPNMRVGTLFHPFATKLVCPSPHVQLLQAHHFPVSPGPAFCITQWISATRDSTIQPAASFSSQSNTPPFSSSSSDVAGHSPISWNHLDLASYRPLNQWLTVPWHHFLQVLVKPVTAFVKSMSVIPCNLSPFLPRNPRAGEIRKEKALWMTFSNASAQDCPQGWYFQIHSKR